MNEVPQWVDEAFASFNDEPDVKSKTNGAGNKTAGNTNRFDWRDHVYTAAELQRKTFPPVSYCVPDLIPEGLTIIAGKPKIGKSWMALDICVAVAGAHFCLGDRKPIQGDVLYAAMEDNERRMQRRTDRLLKTFGEQWPERLTLAHSWRRLDKGGVDDVRQWIEQANNPRLVVLDTLASVKPIRTQQGYTEDYESLAALHRLANEKGVSIILLHHTRKMEAEDPVDTGQRHPGVGRLRRQHPSPGPFVARDHALCTWPRHRRSRARGKFRQVRLPLGHPGRCQRGTP
jgi:predicted ATP-dependent serine protease